MKITILFALLATFGLPAFSQKTCSSLFTSEGASAYQSRGIKIVDKYPQFKDLLSNPQKYFKKMSGRFEMQKISDPAHLYDFDFSEWSLPLFQDMHRLLLIKRADVSNRIETLRANSVSAWLHRNKIAKAELGIVYFEQLLKELEAHLKNGKASYRETFELSYFYSRAAGLFDVETLKLLSLPERLTLKLDAYTEGFREQSVQEEYELYLQRKMILFDKNSPISTWQAAAEPFTNAIFNKNKFEVLILPTTEPLGNDIFMHLLSSEIYLIGVGTNPIAADGYFRPSGLFFLHDLRHASFMYYRTILYKQQHDLSREHIDELSLFMAEQIDQLDAELASMQDRDLVGAIQFYLFNQHHDGGYHFAPSNYLTNNAYHAPFILYIQMKLAGQKREFNSMKDIARAREWLKAFWIKRVAAEQELIQSFKS